MRVDEWSENRSSLNEFKLDSVPPPHRPRLTTDDDLAGHLHADHTTPSGTLPKPLQSLAVEHTTVQNDTCVLRGDATSYTMDAQPIQFRMTTRMQGSDPPSVNNRWTVS